jgi:hypothetical protein
MLGCARVAYRYSLEPGASSSNSDTHAAQLLVNTEQWLSGAVARIKTWPSDTGGTAERDDGFVR